MLVHSSRPLLGTNTNPISFCTQCLNFKNNFTTQQNLCFGHQSVDFLDQSTLLNARAEVLIGSAAHDNHHDDSGKFYRATELSLFNAVNLSYTLIWSLGKKRCGSDVPCSERLSGFMLNTCEQHLYLSAAPAMDYFPVTTQRISVQNKTTSYLQYTWDF